MPKSPRRISREIIENVLTHICPLFSDMTGDSTIKKHVLFLRIFGWIKAP